MVEWLICLTWCHLEQLENPLPKGLFARMSGTSSASWSFSSQAVSHSPGPVRVADIPTAWWSQGGCISYTAASFQEAGGGKSQTIQGLPQELAFGSFPPCPIDPRLFYAAVTRPPNLSCLILLKFISDSCEKVYCGYSHLPGELFSAGWFIFPGCFGLKAPLYQHVLPRSLQDKKTEFACSHAKAKCVPFTHISWARAS